MKTKINNKNFFNFILICKINKKKNEKKEKIMKQNWCMLRYNISSCSEYDFDKF